MCVHTLIIVFSCIMFFASSDVNGQGNPHDLQQVDDKDDVLIDPNTTAEEASRIIEGLRPSEKQVSPTKEIRFPSGSLWDKKSSMDERLSHLRGRSLLENWIRWPTDLTANLDNDRQGLVRTAFQRRVHAQETNFESFEQAMSTAPVQPEAQIVEKLLMQLVDREGQAEQALINELDEILAPEQLEAFVKGYMKHPLLPFVASPLGELYLDLSEAQFRAISELHEKQTSLFRISNVSTEKDRVQYAKKQLPLLGTQILAVLTEAQMKKYWDLLPGADPRLSFEDALAKRPSQWQKVYLDYLKARRND